MRRAILAASLSCAIGSISSAADPVPSREYPNTYSSRKAPWYDPFRVFTSPPKAAQPKAVPSPVEHASVPVPMPVPTFRQPSRPAEVPSFMGTDASAPNSVPAWKWYGYGTPSHNAFANTPSTSGAVPPGFGPSSSVVTIPLGPPKPISPIGVPQLFGEETLGVVVPPGEGPRLPGTVVPPPSATASDVSWKSSPGATLKPPTNDTPAVKPEGPSASLRKPVPIEEKPAAAPAEYSTPLSRISPPSETSKDIPVVPAPGIAVPK